MLGVQGLQAPGGRKCLAPGNREGEASRHWEGGRRREGGPSTRGTMGNRGGAASRHWEQGRSRDEEAGVGNVHSPDPNAQKKEDPKAKPHRGKIPMVTHNGHIKKGDERR